MNNKDSTRLERELKACIYRQGMTISSFVERVGYGRSIFYAFINGTDYVSDQFKRKVATFMENSLNELDEQRFGHCSDQMQYDTSEYVKTLIKSHEKFYGNQ